MRICITGLVGGLLGFIPFAGWTSAAAFGSGDKDLGDEVYGFFYGFTAVYAVAISASIGPIWLRVPVLFLVAVISLIAALSPEWPLGFVFVLPAILSFVGAFTSGRELARVWDK